MEKLWVKILMKFYKVHIFSSFILKEKDEFNDFEIEISMNVKIK